MTTQSERGITRGMVGDADLMMIPAGAIVYSTHPQWPKEGKVSRRRINLAGLNYVRWETEQIVWAGSSGYWRWIKREELKDLV